MSKYWIIESDYGYDGAEFDHKVDADYVTDYMYKMFDGEATIWGVEPVTKLELYASQLDIY